MRVSAVVPLYNKEHYIQRSVESILLQNTPVDEIIVVDDGSIDGSAKVVKNIIDSRVHLIQQKNSGEGAARNRGVSEARNQLVAFLDADDEWKPDFLTHIQRLVNNFPDCGAYATFYEVISSETGTVYNPPLVGFPPAPFIGIIPNLFETLQGGLPFFPSSVAFPKKTYSDLGGFPEGIKRGCDTMMWIKLGVNYPIAYSSSRQVIYHTEAENRACLMYPSEGEAVNIQLMEQMFSGRQVPPDLVNSVKDYYAYLHVRKALDLIKEGDQDQARIFLGKAKNNRKHRREWLKWSLLSYTPTILVKMLAQIKRKFA